jgi:membrane-bound metal-dependent hydrolase YbcI (DUF457 family)
MPLVIVSVIGAVAASPLPDVDQKIGIPHRRVTHWPSMQIAFFAACAFAGAYLAPGFTQLIAVLTASMAFGCVMHSCADAMTVDKHGIQLLWPVSRRGYHLLPWSCRVWVGNKSASEKAFVAIWMAFVLIYAYARFGHLIFA